MKMDPFTFCLSSGDHADVYCHGTRLTDETKKFDNYELESEDSLVIVPKMKLPSATCAGRTSSIETMPIEVCHR